MHTMEFVRDNADGIPFGVVTSTARKGAKWFDQVNPGDVINFRRVEDQADLGNAVVIGKRVWSYQQVIHNARLNYAGIGLNWRAARRLLAQQLKAAYGDIDPDEPMSVIDFIRLNSSPAEPIVPLLSAEPEFIEEQGNEIQEHLRRNEVEVTVAEAVAGSTVKF